MELKEVVNLRKLREFYDSKAECLECPFSAVCIGRICLVEDMLGIDSTVEDMYDKEANGTLTRDYQVPVADDIED